MSLPQPDGFFTHYGQTYQCSRLIAEKISSYTIANRLVFGRYIVKVNRNVNLMENVSFKEISANLILVKCSFVSIVIVKGTKLAVIDTGIAELMPTAIDPALKYLNASLEDVDYVINTHGHWDHIQGNLPIVEASRAEVWIPSTEMEKLSRPADRFLSDGEIIDLGDSMTFEVITVPGHSIGISCLYDRDRQLLIASDAAQGYGGTGIPLIFHSPKQYRASIEKLLTIDIETIILGHPFMWSGSSRFYHRGKDTVVAYLQECLEASKKVSNVIQEVVGDRSDHSYEYIYQTINKCLLEDMSYGFDPTGSVWGHGTIISELKELGLI